MLHNNFLSVSAFDYSGIFWLLNYWSTVLINFYFKIFLAYLEFRSVFCFRIMVFIALCELYQQFVLGMNGFFIQLLNYWSNPVFIAVFYIVKNNNKFRKCLQLYFNILWLLVIIFINFTQIHSLLNMLTLTTIFLLNSMLAINRLSVVIKMYILSDYSDGEIHWEKLINKVRKDLKYFYFLLPYQKRWYFSISVITYKLARRIFHEPDFNGHYFC